MGDEVVAYVFNDHAVSIRQESRRVNRYAQLSTAGGSADPIEGTYDDRAVFIKDNGKRADATANFHIIDVLIEGKTLTMAWSWGDARTKKLQVEGTGIALGAGSFVAIQGGSYGEDSAGGILVFDVVGNKLVGRYADNGATIGLYKEILVAPASVVAKAPTFWK